MFKYGLQTSLVGIVQVTYQVSICQSFQGIIFIDASSSFQNVITQELIPEISISIWTASFCSLVSSEKGIVSHHCADLLAISTRWSIVYIIYY